LAQSISLGIIAMSVSLGKGNSVALWKVGPIVVVGLAVYCYLRRRSARRAIVSERELEILSSTDDEARVALLKRLFARIYGNAPEQMALAGGRVNLIGEHVDYPDVQFKGSPVVHLFSMGGAVQNNYLAAGARRNDGNIVLCHAQVGDIFTIPIAELESLEARAEADRNDGTPMQDRSTPVWAQHTLGAIMEIIRAGIRVTGLSLLLTSNVPHGAGMSNSAANCIALGLVFNALFPKLGIDSQIKLVTFARNAENSRFAGGHCGWLDQLLIVCSKAGMLTKIDYSDNGIQHFESKLPSHMQFAAFNTNVPHVLAESDYSHRVRELTIGIEFLSKLLKTNAGGPNLKLGTINALLMTMDPTALGSKPIDLDKVCDGCLTQFDIVKSESANPLGDSEVERIKRAVEVDFKPPSDLPMHKGKSPKQSFAVILRRMRHQKMSSLIVPLAGEAVAQGNAELFGMLLDLEGVSLRMSGDFMITGDNGAQDALLDCALAGGKNLKLRVHGRMLGGGGGGNVLLMVDTSDRALRRRWEEEVKTAYSAWACMKFPGEGIKATVIVPEISAGARLVSTKESL